MKISKVKECGPRSDLEFKAIEDQNMKLASQSKEDREKCTKILIDVA